MVDGRSTRVIEDQRGYPRKEIGNWITRAMNGDLTSSYCTFKGGEGRRGRGKGNTGRTNRHVGSTAAVERAHSYRARSGSKEP